MMSDGERLRSIAITIHSKSVPIKFLKTDNSKLWKSCLLCGGRLVQLRKALFKCVNCKLEIVADENDMVAEDKQ